ncbi:MAG: hypothetical protein ACI9Q3_001258 [Maribacter sp.]|jgi:hypothetical protein
MNKFTILIVLAIFHFSFFAQQKFEKEYRINSNEIPVRSLQIIKMWNFKKKVKWFAEESNDGKTFEAKVVYKRHRYSIEFSEEGQILDVEKKVKFSELSGEIQRKIKENLSKKFKKYRIKKVQVQYSGTETAIYNEVFQLKTTHESTNINFEIVLKAKKENDYALYEILTDNKGNLIKELKFKQESSLNLEF